MALTKDDQKSETETSKLFCSYIKSNCKGSSCISWIYGDYLNGESLGYCNLMDKGEK